MNVKILFFFLFMINIFVYPQTDVKQLGWGVGEIYIGTQGLDIGETVQYKMNVLGTFWGDINPYKINTPSIYIDAIALRVNEQTNKTIVDFTNTDFNSFEWPYFRMNIVDDQGLNSFGFGLYRFSIEPFNAYFYIDYRDDNFSSYSNCAGHCQDIWIKYEKSEDQFYYNINGFHLQDPNNWVSIENGQLLFVYKIKGQSSFSTDEFPFFWKNCLAITDFENGNPRLFWSKHPTFTTTNYKIYRAISSVSNPRTLTYNLIHTTASEDIFEYTDQDVAQGNSDYVFYYVAAYNSNTNSTSEPSNVVTTRGGMYKQNQLSEEHKTGNIKYELSQNTPNPFNPSTTISFTVPSSTEYYSVLQNVTLKVYDILGNEVATLVDENKPAGVYNVQCIMNNASSGVYFYTLKAGSFTETKKMLLMK